MSRTRRVAIDQDNTWLYRAFFDNSPDNGGEFVVDHADDDYIVLAAGAGDDPAFSGLATPLFDSFTHGNTNIVVWGKGLISFGDPTDEQRAFMAAANAETDLSLFPGAYISAGFLAGVDLIFIGVKSDHTEITFTNQFDDTESSQVNIYPDHITIAPAHLGGGIDFGTGVTLLPGEFFTSTFDLTALLVQSGGPNADILTGTDAPQTLEGLGGDDLLTAGNGAVTIYGDGGNDTIIGSRNNDLLFGGDDNDTIFSGRGDYVDGGNGDDEITAGPQQTIAGGDGTDRLIIDFSTSQVPVNLVLGFGPDGFTGDRYSIRYTGIELFTINGGIGNDALEGTNGDDRLYGGPGADTLLGKGGNDILGSGTGGQAPEQDLTAGGNAFEFPVLLDGTFNPAGDGGFPRSVVHLVSDTGDRFSTADFFAFTAGEGAQLKIDLSQVEDDNLAFYRIRLFDEFGNELINDDGSFSLDGFPHINTNLTAGVYFIEIRSDSNFIRSTGFDTVISLSTAAIPVKHNVLKGGTGDDTYYAHAADDVLVEKAGEGRDFVAADVTWRLGSNFEDLRLAGTDAINGTGNDLDNELTGNSAVNVLKAGAGNDSLNGAGGADIMVGGTGNDTYFVDNRLDRVREGVDEGVDTVISTITVTLAANVENLTLKGTDAINGNGNALANTLAGNAAANVLKGGDGTDLLRGMGGIDNLQGGAGADKLDGGAGNDLLIGGIGADRFVFDKAGLATSTVTSGAERIMDFSHAERDRIDLRAIDANGALAGDAAFAFIGGDAFSKVAGQLRTAQLGSNTYLFGDTNGDAKADFVIRLDGHVDLVAADLIL